MLPCRAPCRLGDNYQQHASSHVDGTKKKIWWAGSADTDQVCRADLRHAACTPKPCMLPQAWGCALQEVKERFGSDIEAAAAGKLSGWQHGYEALASVILQDQLTRLIFVLCPFALLGIGKGWHHLSTAALAQEHVPRHTPDVQPGRAGTGPCRGSCGAPEAATPASLPAWQINFCFMVLGRPTLALAAVLRPAERRAYSSRRTGCGSTCPTCTARA